MSGNKDWNGNKNSIFKTLGASNHTEKERQNEDYYATEPAAADWLIKLEEFNGKPIWECASGENHLADVFKQYGFSVKTSDIVKRTPSTEVIDFLTYDGKWKGHIITNPPYNKAKEFVEKAIELVNDGDKVCMFLKVQFLEGKARKKLFETYPPKRIWVSSSRLLCAKNGKFEEMRAGGGSAVAYAWFVWEKGYKGDTIVKWFN